MIKKIKLEEAVELTHNGGGQLINVEVLQHGYFDTWVVNYLGEDYKFKFYTDKNNIWNMLNPPMVEMVKVKLVEKTVVVKEWVECE